jgi:TolB-like protein/Tfp pilus assembly protein PilF
MKGFSSSRSCLRFGVFEADLASRELRKNGNKIRLQDQPFQVLTLLLENRGQVVTREELRQKIWPADTFVDFDNSLNAAVNKIREALGDSAENPRFVETLPRRGYRFVASLEDKKSEGIHSLAVLPLENLSGDPEQEYFAEGMNEALINTLAKIGGLRVISRTTAMHYKGVHRPVREIARELQVDAIVEGTVMRSTNRVRISVQLIDALADVHLWAESYDRDIRDVLLLQAEVAQAIAREVQVKLTPLEKAQFTQVSPIDPQAYEAYLKGRYYWNRRSGEGLKKATQCFQQAIGIEPTYAAAQAGLAECVGLLGWWGFVSPEEGCGKAKGLAKRALEMDPNLAEAHSSLAWSTMHYDYDFRAAEREYERSIELNPRHSTARHWFGLHQAMIGRYEEGYAELKRAIRLDPNSSMIHTTLGYIQFCAGRYDQATELFEKALQLDPNLFHARVALGHTHSFRSQHDRGIAEIQKGIGEGGDIFITWLGEAYARAGHSNEADKVLEHALERSKRQYVSAYFIARLYAALGKSEDALGWLETAYQERAAWMAFLKIDPVLDVVRARTSFQDLLCRMDFPDA